MTHQEQLRIIDRMRAVKVYIDLQIPISETALRRQQTTLVWSEARSVDNANCC